MTSKSRSKDSRGRWGLFLLTVVPPLIVFFVAALFRRRQRLERLQGPARSRQAEYAGDSQPALGFTAPTVSEITLPAEPAARAEAPAPPTETNRPAVPDTGAAPAPAARPAEAGPDDDLTRLEGIGPKVAGLLRQNGIHTFRQLAGADRERLRQILDEARLRFIDPDTWPEQAALAADGKMEELDAFVKTLRGGRRTAG